MCCTKSICFFTRLILLLGFININNTGLVHASPRLVDSLGPRNAADLPGWTKGSMEVAYSSEAVLISFGLLVSLVLFAVLCTGGGCCQNIFGKREQEDTQSVGLSNSLAGLANNSNGSGSSEAGHAIEMGHVQFEPLPSLQDLTPGSCDSYGGCRSDNNSAPRSVEVNSPLTEQLISMAQTETTTVHSHDWFDDPRHNFPRTHIEYLKEVGTGWFGKVIEAEAEDIVPEAKRTEVVVKVLRENASSMEQMRFLEECRLYCHPEHRNILKVLGCSVEEVPFLLILEHLDHGDLKSFLLATAKTCADDELLTSEDALLRMGHDVAKGLEWMSSADFTHKDLAARNCQIAGDGRVVIGDYGLSTFNFRNDYYWGSDVAIPLRWSAPESLQCTISTVQLQKVLKSSNVWSFGVVLWEIFEFGKLPYSELSDHEVISRVITDRSYKLAQLSRPFALKNELYQIMLSCWHPQPDSRPGISAVVEVIGTICSSISNKITPKSVHEKLSANSNTSNDFDHRWDDFSEKVNSPQVQEGISELYWEKKHPEILNENNNHTPAVKKKSVSFSTIVQEIPSDHKRAKFSPVHHFEVSLPYGALSDTASTSQCATPENSLMSSLMNNSFDLTTESQNATCVSDSSEDAVSNDTSSWKVSPNSEAAAWQKLTDEGEISQKSKEKSRSAQDILAHFEPSDLSAALFTSRSQAQGAKDSATPKPVVSTNFIYAGSSDSSISEATTVLKKSCSDNTLTHISRSITETNTSNSNENGNPGETASEWQAFNEDEISHGYYADASSISRSEMSIQLLEDSLENDPSTSWLASSSLVELETTPSLDRDSIGAEHGSSKSPIVTSSTASSSSQFSNTGQLEYFNQISRCESDLKIPSDLHVFSTDDSPDILGPTLDSHFLCQSAPAVLTPTDQPGGEIFPDSQLANVPSAFLKVKAGLEPRSLRKVHKNFRNTKTSTPNFSPPSDLTTCSDNSSFFRINDDVFADFSTEFNDPVSPIGKDKASNLYITDSNVGKYRDGHTLLDTDEDFSLHLRQRQALELVSESTSTGSDSNDFFDSLRDVGQPQNLSLSQGMELVTDKTKSGFQDIFGQMNALRTPSITHLSGTPSPVARKLLFESESSVLCGNTFNETRGSATIVSGDMETTGTNSSNYANVTMRDGRLKKSVQAEGEESVQGAISISHTEIDASNPEFCPAASLPVVHVGQEIDGSADCISSSRAWSVQE